VHAKVNSTKSRSHVVVKHRQSGKVEESMRTRNFGSATFAIAAWKFPKFDSEPTVASLTILAFMGVALYAVFSLLEGRITGWAHRKDEFAMG
jgi:hypothetical protein